MTEPVTELSLSGYLDIARRRKRMILTIATLILALVVAVTALQTPLYRAESIVSVDISTARSILDDSTNLSSNVRDRNLRNELRFANSDRVDIAAIEALGFAGEAGVSPDDRSDTLMFNGIDEDADVAALIANTYAEAYVSERSLASGERFLGTVAVIDQRLSEIAVERRELASANTDDLDLTSVQIQLASLDDEETRLRSQLNEINVAAKGTQGTSVAILNRALPPRAPFSPSWFRNVALAIATGILVGLGAALLLDSLDDTVVSKQELERAIDGTPVIGVIPPAWTGRRSRRERRLVTTRTGAFTEAFRSLRSAIELGQVSGKEIGSLLVTSASPGEGKSTVVAHLALSFARGGARVLVIDADMHQPTQHLLFGVYNKNGLAEHLAGLEEADPIVEQASGEGLVSLLPSGTSESPPAELLKSTATQELISRLSEAYDLVIIDSPPLRPVADTPPLARLVDATLLVAMRGKSKRYEINHAMELLARAGARPLGAVFTRAENTGGGYGYGSAKAD